MFGANPKRKALTGDGTRLEVVSIFATLQGEGPFAGWPAIFIRLGGCNLACTFCDTEFEAFGAMALSEITGKVKTLHTNQKLIVITGGEPFRQPIALLCQELLAAGYRVQIETNGTLYREIPPQVEIICSPKSAARIRPDLLKRITAFKFIISAANTEYNHVPQVGQTADDMIYIQPMDEGDAAINARNIEYTRDMALEYGYNMSLQLHKIIGLE